VAPDNSTLSNGSIVATMNATATYSITQSSIGTLEILSHTQGKVDANGYNAIPLSSMPGLGVRVKWMPYAASTSLTPTAQWPFNGAISNVTELGTLLMAKSSSLTNYSITTRFSIELVVIDATTYRGGKLVFNDNSPVSVHYAVRNGTQIPVMCVNGYFNLLLLLQGQTAPPELPRPYLPSCRFDAGALRQHVELDGVTTEEVAAFGSPRSAGTAGEKTFNVLATQCEAGARFNVYFTDANNTNSTANYLATTGVGRTRMGMRLYAANNSTPVQYGPAPVGNAVPANIAVQAGPTVANQTLVLPFTVQHVRLPGVGSADVTPGSMDAATTVTIVYP